MMARRSLGLCAWRVAAIVAAATLMAACSENPQTTTQKRMDEKAWSGTQSVSSAPGWKAGDQAAWEEQLRNRTQTGQNEYNRAAAKP